MIFPTVADIKQFWDWKCYGLADIEFYVDIGWITLDDYKNITGEAYKV
ncbi:XkdX family protein [Bacillus sp. NPDC077027]